MPRFPQQENKEKVVEKVAEPTNQVEVVTMEQLIIYKLDTIISLLTSSDNTTED